MTKHFEQLWVEAEQLASKISPITSDLTSEVIGEINLLSQPNSDKEKCIGRILFAICKISAAYNINVYVALQEIISEMKIDFLNLNH